MQTANVERRILHVDDDPAILRLVSRILSKRGYKVVSVNDPLLAVQKLRESGARIVILDIDMPGKNGLELLQEIKRLDGSIQVFMLTSMVSMGTIIRAARLGSEECLFKPIEDFDELGHAADRVYEKMLRWWRTLREWKARNNMAALEVESQEAMLDQQVWEHASVQERAGNLPAEVLDPFDSEALISLPPGPPAASELGDGLYTSFSVFTASNVDSISGRR